jgi:hypothetical protein
MNEEKPTTDTNLCHCFFRPKRNNAGMKTSENTNGVPSDELADAQTVGDCVAAGRPIPAEVVRRVRERADKARREILAAHGVQDIGVQIIREIRGELPQP